MLPTGRVLRAAAPPDFQPSEKMHKLALAVPLLAVGFAHAVPAVQQPLIPTNGEEIVRGDWSTATASRKLQGKFLHITGIA